jgi:hypothetical protein
MIPTEWVHDSQVDKSSQIKICRMMSPYYEGIRYAVRLDGMCLSIITDEFEYETMPSNRDEAFYEEFRFKSFEQAEEAVLRYLEKKKVVQR